MTHRVFWTIYGVSVALFLGVVRPWSFWIPVGRSGMVIVHESAESLPRAASPGTVVVVSTEVREVPGWLPCDGSRIAPREYPALVRILQSANNSLTAVYVPDYGVLRVIPLEEDPGVVDLCVDSGGGSLDGGHTGTSPTVHFLVRAVQ